MKYFLFLYPNMSMQISFFTHFTSSLKSFLKEFDLSIFVKEMGVFGHTKISCMLNRHALDKLTEWKLDKNLTNSI